MSVPSSKMTVTWERPNFDIDRTSLSFGSPEIACSSGAVTCRSISNGDRTEATVLICTWTGVVSGKASRGRRAEEPDADPDDDDRDPVIE